MNTTWGVYKPRGRLKSGEETKTSDRQAVSFFVRWRVNGVKRRRSFKTRGHASAFYDLLAKAKTLGWAADDRGWPIDPQAVNGSVAVDPAVPAPPILPAHTFESYVQQVWWPTTSTNMEPKNRLGHERNARVAVQLLRLKPGDRRVGFEGAGVGDSIPLPLLDADDVKATLVARRHINGRTAAANQRRMDAACAHAGDETVEVTLDPEVASAATVRAFKITLGMILASASASKHVVGDPMKGTAAFAPKPQPTRMSQRLVPTLDELFDLADAISRLGPVMPDGRPQGARFHSLILRAGTTGGRPGEYVTHQPTWVDLDPSASVIRFHQTEAAIYGKVLEDWERGRRVNVLKHRKADEYREVPMISDVRNALLQHRERGYFSPDRTWVSRTGRGHLDWHNLTNNYWRPALEAVFAGTAKTVLVDASPKILRKTAITWWADQGIHQTLAAEWAGHSEEVAEIYYASRSRTTFAREVALLEVRRR